MRDWFKLCDPREFSGRLRLCKLIEKRDGVLHVELTNVFQCKRKKPEQLRPARALNRKLTGLNPARRQKRLRCRDHEVRKIDIFPRETFYACFFHCLKSFAGLSVVATDHGRKALLQAGPIIKRLPVSRCGGNPAKGRSRDIVVIKDELMSRFRCLFLKFGDRNCGRKDRDLLLGVANENENGKRDDQQYCRACCYDPSRPAFSGRDINHVATGQFFIGAFKFGNELVIRGKTLRRFGCDHSLQNPRRFRRDFGGDHRKQKRLLF